jgi:5-methyltetrahydrofolate--homocysteine methyltransferase
VNKIRNILKKRILFLDGATGTELQKRGMPPGVCPEIWCLDNPHVIEGIHYDYRKSGADVIYTCTFGANSVKLGQYGVSNVCERNRELAMLARHAAGKNALIAGDIGPTGRFVKPFGDLDFEEAVNIFKVQVQGLLDGGVDLFVIETMMDIQEARAALIAVKEITDKFVMVTMTYEKDGHTLNGTDPTTALVTLQSLGADAVGCNCSTGPAEMISLIAQMKPYATVPLVAKPNAGMPELVGDQTVFNMQPSKFAAYGKEFVSRGVNILGGCCGTSPDHIRELIEQIASEKPVAPVRKTVSAVSSSSRTVVFERSNPLRIIGERINPTGKKALQEELLTGKMALVRKMAREQEKKGADLLDVNVGVPGSDEKMIMEGAINLLSTASSLPLVIDSPSVKVVEAALRLYPGRALINSISGEEKKIKKLLPLAAKYGAMFILLPLNDRGVPEKAEERKEIIKEVFKEAQTYGFTKADIIIDGLVMTVSADSQAPLETLKTVEWCSRNFKCCTVLGLTNVSFGLPERKWLNAAFLAMAVERELTMAIANPGIEELMDIKTASDVLIDRDKDASRYIARFTKTIQEGEKKAVRKSVSSSDEIFRIVLEGNRDEIETVLAMALRESIPALKLVDDIMIPAITKVGNLFDKKEYFLPQLIASAETMKKGLAYLDPYLRNDKSAQKQKGLILICTVQGDIHDIGKNIVALMLNNNGFEVINLGKDVSAEKIVEEVKRHRPAIVALSALMTTTMVNMKKVINATRNEGLECDFMIGGAVVTRPYAESIGARYARDGVEAVRIAEKILI